MVPPSALYFDHFLICDWLDLTNHTELCVRFLALLEYASLFPGEQQDLLLFNSTMASVPMSMIFSCNLAPLKINPMMNKSKAVFWDTADAISHSERCEKLVFMLI